MDLTTAVRTARPNFLLLTPACVALGAGTARWTYDRPLHGPHVALALLGALAAHISVNALNEYADFRSGLDLHTRRTPFSGGTGALPERPASASSALALGLISAAFTAALGLYFLLTVGAGILWVGLPGLVLILAYTRWITRSPLLCLVAPGLGFGPLMVMGTDFVLTGTYSVAALAASLVPFFLVSDLLLLNQFPDVEPDRAVGRDHLLIALGPRAGTLVYSAFLAGAYLAIVGGVWARALPAMCLLGLLMLPPAILTVRGVWHNADRVERLLPWMGLNVVLNLTTPLLVALGLFLAAA